MIVKHAQIDLKTCAGRPSYHNVTDEVKRIVAESPASCKARKTSAMRNSGPAGFRSSPCICPEPRRHKRHEARKGRAATIGGQDGKDIVPILIN